MHGNSRGSRPVALAAAVTATAAYALTAGAGTALAAPAPPAWCKSGGTLSARAMPQKIRIADCDLRGRTVRGANGLTAVVPEDGTSLVAHALRTGGGGAELRIDVDDAAGEITISASGARVPEGRPRGFRAAADPCRDGTYRLQASSWPRGATIAWRYHPGSGRLPMTGIARGVSNMVNARTDCGGGSFTPPPAVDARYAGRSASRPNVTAQAACGTRDRVNTFGWLAMTGTSGSVLAATCIWYKGGTTLESDMALQERGKRWWTDGSCPSGSYSAEAVATHETGHVLGLDHVGGPSHSELTMAPSVAACDDGPATLGRGDYNGLIALYGAR